MLGKDILECLIQFDNPNEVKIVVEYLGCDTELTKGDRLRVRELEFEKNTLVLECY